MCITVATANKPAKIPKDPAALRIEANSVLESPTFHSLKFLFRVAPLVSLSTMETFAAASALKGKALIHKNMATPSVMRRRTVVKGTYIQTKPY